MALFDDASLVVTPNGYQASVLYSIKPTSGAGDMTVDRLTTATRVNSAGLIESVANKVPRLDYSNGSCPSLLVEPQRTNLALYSEQFDNVAWQKTSTTITANAIVSPDGSTNADLITFSAAVLNISQPHIVTAGQTHTASIFVKAGSLTQFRFGFSDNIIDEGIASFNLTTLTATPIASTSWINQSSSIQSYGNGWYRCIYTGTNTSVSITIPIVFRANAAGNLYLYGAQHEANSAYPTSYIPTTSAAVTRNADAIYKTGISSLIGQTEGVLFLDLFASAKNNDANTFGTWLVAGTATENFQIYNLGSTLYWYARNTGGIIIDQTANQTIVEGTRYKIAYAYKSGDYALYINGVQKRTSANANVPAVSQFNLSAGGYGASPAIVKNEYNSAILFPTRLTNAELISLTTI